MTPSKPARRALIAFALVASAQALAAQVYTVPPPDPAAQAAVQRKLRRIEAKLARRLEASHGDPAAGVRLGEALRGVGEDRLDHPSTAVRAAVAAARHPAALALAIAGDAEGLSDTATTYETDVLLIARLDRSPHAVLLVLDRLGRRGLLILENPPFYGELYRLEAHDGGLVGVLFGSWIS
jgi:hypothetical protein